ncbi:MAG: hypothetical protein HY984_00605, partial [Candidatus Magasanikbacteria bacterium]|nr:hypothetical protein [Candidatus Magasanikbacteria bacterium]
MWRRTFYIIAVAGAMAAGVGAAPARAFDFCKDWGMFCPEPPPPPPPVIEITCDKTVVPQGWGQKAWCVTPGKAHPGEVIIVKGKNFPGGTTYNGDVRFFYSDGRRLNSAVGLLMGTPSVSKINDNGTFAVAIIVPSTDMQNQGKPPVGQFRVEVFTFVNCQNVCNQNDPDLKPKEMRARASAQIQIEAGVNPLPLPGGGDFPVTCKWEEWVYDDLGVPQRKDPTSSERCAKGASFTFQHHFPLTLRGEYTRLYLRDSDTSHCQNSELIPEGGDKKACYYVVGNAPAGLVCDPWKGCTGERSDQTEIQHAISLCRAIAPAAGKPKNGLDWRDADCDVMGNGSIGGQLRNDAVYQVAVRSYYNRTQKAEHWWEVASKPFTIFDAPKLGNFQYKTKQFTISFLADRIEHEEAKTGLPIYSKQYLQPGQIVPGYDGFRFFFKVSPPAGETIGPFPKHKIKITDLDPLGQTKDFASGSVEPDKDGVYSVYGGYRVPSPEDEAAIYGVHTYIVQCVDCAQDAFLRDSDPKNSRNGWYVTYPDLRFTAEVIRRNTLPVSKIFLNKTVVKPGDKLEITGKNFSPQTILNEVTFSGYSEKDRPPYNIVLDGWPEGKALWTNVNPDGTFRLVINVPKNAGLHTSKKREDVQVGVAMSLGKSSFREFVKVTLDTSDCPDQTSTISIVKTRDAATDS